MTSTPAKHCEPGCVRSSASFRQLFRSTIPPSIRNEESSGLISEFLPCLLFSFPCIRCPLISRFTSSSLHHSTTFAPSLHSHCTFSLSALSQQCLLLSPDAFVYTMGSVFGTLPSLLTLYSSKSAPLQSPFHPSDVDVGERVKGRLERCTQSQRCDATCAIRGARLKGECDKAARAFCTF